MKRIAWRTVLPAFLAIALFTGVVFLYLLPSLDRVVRDQKRLMIRELTESAWNVLARFEADEQAGRSTRAQAQANAIAQVRNLHYGQQSKDYFWIIDMHPNMVVHPYRPDLEGADLSDFSDPQGKRLFVEMARVVEAQGSGYVSYMWQWKDDSQRIVPKLSYVKGFAPWGWIIGTGVYTEDVDAEITALTGNLQTASFLILCIVSLLMYILLRAGFQAERGRLRLTTALQSSEEKYRLLVESAGESIVMAIAGEGLYANASLLHLLGYTRQEFAALDIATIIRPTAAEIANDRHHWQAVTDGVEAPSRYEAELVRKDGRILRVMLTLSRIVVQKRAGFMAVATRLSQPRELDIASATNLDDLEAASRRLRDLAALMINHGAEAGQVSRMLSSGADDVVRRAVDFIITELGPPPVPFDIMLMGSLGRAEVTLHADQDHALIHDDVPDDQALAVRHYFLKIGRRVSELLDASGYPFCLGKIMSGEPECCQSLSVWYATFDRWVTTLEAEDLLRAKIFFDFRSALDEGRLVDSLHRHLQETVRRHPRFLPLLADNILRYEPPLNTFGQFVLETARDGRSGFDIKGVLAQVVDVVRLRALQKGIAESGTIDRLQALSATGLLRPDTAAEIEDTYRVLLDLRLKHQAKQRAEKLEADNLIDPQDLDPTDRDRLKQAFVRIKALQENLRREFGVQQ